MAEMIPPGMYASWAGEALSANDPATAHVQAQLAIAASLEMVADALDRLASRDGPAPG
jgi:hypothetical protein